jgi:hypothetical protein
LDHRYLILVDHLELRDSEAGEPVMEYRQESNGGDTRALKNGIEKEEGHPSETRQLW